MDSSIRIWALPAPAHTTYAPYDSTRARGELIGHTDAVWDLALARDESTLISCGAEGLVKVWDVSGPSGGGSLKLSWSYDGLETSHDLSPEGDMPGATAIEAIKTDLKKVAVAYQNAAIKIFDIETGKELSKFQIDPVEGGELLVCSTRRRGRDVDETGAGDSISAQANSIVSHPTMPLLITGHEDKHIRIFDIVASALFLSFMNGRTPVEHTLSTQASAHTRCSRTLTLSLHYRSTQPASRSCLVATTARCASGTFSDPAHVSRKTQATEKRHARASSTSSSIHRCPSWRAQALTAW